MSQHYLFGVLERLQPQHLDAVDAWEQRIRERSQNIAKGAKRQLTLLQHALVSQAREGSLPPVRQRDENGEWVEGLREKDVQAYHFYLHGGDPDSPACRGRAEEELKDERVPEWVRVGGTVLWEDGVPRCQAGTPWGFIVERMIEHGMPGTEDDLHEAVRLVSLGTPEHMPPEMRKFAGRMDAEGFTVEWVADLRSAFSDDSYVLELLKTEPAASLCDAGANQPGNTPKPKLPKAPSKEANRAYTACKVVGLTQIAVAKEMGTNQGQVSRYVKEVEEFIVAGGVLVPLTSNRPKVIPPDPAILIMGERTDHRTPKASDLHTG